MPLRSGIWMLCILILACGTTYGLDILTTWYPVYRVSGLIKAAAAASSLSCAFAVIALIPRATAICGQLEARDLELRLHGIKRERAESSFRGLLESAPDAMVIVNDKGEITLVNGQAEKLFGYRRGEMLGHRVEMLLPARFRDSHAQQREGYFKAPYARAMDSKLELFGVRKGGIEFPAEVSLSHFMSEDGAMVCSAIRDISKRKAAEHELARVHDEALQALRLKSIFIANMSHELRTPLNGIIGFAELLHDGYVEPGSEEQKRSLGDILSSARHLLSLINDVLDMARVEAGKMEFAPEAIDLAGLAREVGSVLRSVGTQKNIRLATEIAPDLGEVVLDPVRLKQVLYNYLSNALKFTRADTQVTIRIRPEGKEHFRVEVEDEGEGIRAEDLGRLFTEFTQLGPGTDRKNQGTGLGLALSKRIVEAQGGSVGVRSELGKGSVFWAVLPRRFPIGGAAGAPGS